MLNKLILILIIVFFVLIGVFFYNHQLYTAPQIEEKEEIQTQIKRVQEETIPRKFPKRKKIFEYEGQEIRTIPPTLLRTYFISE